MLPVGANGSDRIYFAVTANLHISTNIDRRFVAVSFFLACMQFIRSVFDVKYILLPFLISQHSLLLLLILEITDLCALPLS